MESQKGQESQEERQVSQMGFAGWRPTFFRRFNNPTMFTAIFSVSSFFLIVPYGVLLVILPTLERVFNLNSKQTGQILLVNDISGVIASVFMTNWYSAKKIRWIGIGNLLIVAGYLCPVWTTLVIEYPAPQTPESHNISSSHDMLCDGRKEEGRDWANRNHYYYFIFLFGLFLQGFGANAPVTAGMTYLDEIFHQKDFAIALAVVAVFSFVGYPFGLALGSEFLGWHVTLSMPEGMTVDSAEFIGAWWLGILIPSVIGFFLAFIVLLYPQQMPAAKVVLESKIRHGIATLKEKQEELNQSFVEVTRRMIPDFQRLLRNRALNFLVIGDVFFSLQIGWQAYEPKIYAKLFRLTDTTVGLFLGIFHGGGFILGIIMGGLLVKRKDWKPKQLNFIFFTLSLVSIPFLFGALLNCPMDKPPIAVACNSDCNCTTDFYDPVCDDVSGATYFSPCFAGCNRVLDSINDEINPIWGWGNCSCATSGIVHPGECGSTCSETMAISLAITTIQQVIQYAGFVSLNVVFQRIVDESDRTIAQGLRQCARKALGTIPSPLLFGWMIDRYCTIWKTSSKDGSRGNCWVYDTETMIIWLCAVQVGLRLLSSLFYYLCWLNYPAHLEEDSAKNPLIQSRQREYFSSTCLTSEEE